MRGLRLRSVATPLCPAGHLPLKGGDWLGAPASRAINRHHLPPTSRVNPDQLDLASLSPLTEVDESGCALHYPISPLEGEMSGRTEGGGREAQHDMEHGMPHAPVPPKNRTNARKMRKALTDAELKLWNELRAHRLM